MDSLTFQQLREANIPRAIDLANPIEPNGGWTESDWACALAGEVGELCDAIKKRRRGKEYNDRMGKHTPTSHECAMEMADIAIYLDLIAAKMGVDLAAAIREKFNAVSIRAGSKVVL